MEIHNATPLARLANARRWLQLFEGDLDECQTSDADPSATRAERILVEFTKAYIKDLMHSTRLAVEYDDEYERYGELKFQLDHVNVVFDTLTNLWGAEQMLPSEVQALTSWLFECVCDLVGQIRRMDEENPRLQVINQRADRFFQQLQIQ